MDISVYHLPLPDPRSASDWYCTATALRDWPSLFFNLLTQIALNSILISAKISSSWNSRGTFVTITVSIGLWMVSLAEEPPSRLEGQCSTICFLILSLSICTMHVPLISSARSPWSSYSLMSVISFGPYFWQIPILITTLLRLAYLLSTTKHFFQSKTGLLLTWLDIFFFWTGADVGPPALLFSSPWRFLSTRSDA